MYSADGEFVEFGHSVLLEGPVEVWFNCVVPENIRDFKKPRRRRQRERGNNVLMSKTVTKHVCYTISYISLQCSGKQQREMTSFKGLGRTGTHDSEFFFFYLNLIKRRPYEF